MVGALAATLVTNVDFSFGSAALWPLVAHHGGDQAALATASSAFATARLVATPATGWLADRLATRALILGFLALYALSAVLTVGAQSVETVYLARFAAGLGICVLAVISRHITTTFATDPEQRTRALSDYFMAQSVGMVLTPAVSAVLGSVAFSVAGVDVGPHNAQGLITLAATIVGAVFVVASMGSAGPAPAAATSNKRAAAKSAKAPKSATTAAAATAPIAACLFAWFAGVTLVGVLQVNLAPLTESRFGWTRFEAGLVLSAMGALNATVLYAVKTLKPAPRLVAHVSTAAGVAHAVLIADLPGGLVLTRARFLAAAALWCVCHAGLSVALASAYAGLVAQTRAAGMYMALLPLATSAARIASARLVATLSHGALAAALAVLGVAMAAVIALWDSALFGGDSDGGGAARKGPGKTGRGRKRE
jgi:MFS family permease